MMRASNITAMRGFRPPTQAEIVAVSRIMTLYYAGTVRVCKGFTAVSCAMGLVCLSSVGVGGWPCIVFGVLCYAAAIAAIASKNRCYANQKIFRDGDFVVLDGYVCKLESSERVGRINVKFISAFGEGLDGWFSVRQEGVRMNTPLLLVWADETKIKHGLTWVFSPFMMTEEAAKLRW